jgi:hypothetical protein
MSTVESTLTPVPLPHVSRWQKMRRTLRSWLTTWEIYPILLVASFLHFYQLGITEFDDDQAMLFGMDCCRPQAISARSAQHISLLPFTCLCSPQPSAQIPWAARYWSPP